MCTNYVYIIECNNRSLYTGYCADLEKRMIQHFTGKGGAKFTKAFKPVKISVAWSLNANKGDAMRVESFIKGLKRSEKILLIEKPESLREILEVAERQELSDIVNEKKIDVLDIDQKIKKEIEGK